MSPEINDSGRRVPPRVRELFDHKAGVLASVAAEIPDLIGPAYAQRSVSVGTAGGDPTAEVVITRPPSALEEANRMLAEAVKLAETARAVLIEGAR